MVFKGTSKIVQNELLSIMLEVCHEKIIQEVEESDYLAVIQARPVLLMYFRWL